MKVLIACEESQAVCKEFRQRGFEAYSCDILPCSGGHPEWHLQEDVLQVINREHWDVMIAHPPCTYLSEAGARWTYKNGLLNTDRYELGLKAKSFFLSLFDSSIKHVAIENPTPMKIFDLPKQTQVIQPYYFGDPYSKRTLLWLKNLPRLYHNDSSNLFDHIVTHAESYVPYLPSNVGGKKRGQKYSFGVSKNSKQHSKTFPGIAQAMAEQWGNYLKSL